MSVDLLVAGASGMDAQQASLNVFARNIAAAQAAGPNGNAARMVPTFRVVESDDGALVQVVGAHVEAGKTTDVLSEMIAVMNASRAYEANASLFDVGKTLAEKTIAMGAL